MSYSKIILTLIISSIFFLSCKDKKTIEPEPEEYFSFYADGEYFNYPQIKGLGFGGTGQTLEAYGAGTAGYIITGYSRDKPLARGYLTIVIHGGQIPNQDTVILDGIANSAALVEFKFNSNSFEIYPPLKGKVIFSQRETKKISGTFEFEAFRIIDDGNGSFEISDSVIHITNGKFSIIPSP